MDQTAYLVPAFACSKHHFEVLGMFHYEFGPLYDTDRPLPYIMSRSSPEQSICDYLRSSLSFIYHFTNTFIFHELIILSKLDSKRISESVSVEVVSIVMDRVAD